MNGIGTSIQRMFISSDDDSLDWTEPPEPLPAHVSAALSCLALALAPHKNAKPNSLAMEADTSTREDGELIKEPIHDIPLTTLAASTANLGVKYPSNTLTSRSRQMARRAVSDTSVALAHRRRSSYQPILRLEQEPTTIPGKVVNDVICLAAVAVDWAECIVIVVYRIVLSVRLGRRATM